MTVADAGSGCTSYTVSATIAPIPACTPDPHELNDTWAARLPFPTNASTFAVTESSPKDWFSTVIPAWTTVRVDVGFVHLVGNLDVWTYNDGGGSFIGQGQSRSSTDDEVVVFENTDIVDHVFSFAVQVVDEDTAAACVPYTVDVGPPVPLP